jgi:hypothetical protein
MESEASSCPQKTQRCQTFPAGTMSHAIVCDWYAKFQAGQNEREAIGAEVTGRERAKQRTNGTESGRATWSAGDTGAHRNTPTRKGIGGPLSNLRLAVNTITLQSASDCARLPLLF